MARKVIHETKLVEIVTILCDLCGSDKNMPRYARNRVCRVCGREVCGDCQGPYSDDDYGMDETICKKCRALESKYLEPINETYRTRQRLEAEWKAESHGGTRAGEKGE